MADHLANLADRVAARMDTANTDEVRDVCDLLSGGQLDCFQLDLATDLAVKRIVASKMFREKYRIQD